MVKPDTGSYKKLQTPQKQRRNVPVQKKTRLAKGCKNAAIFSKPPSPIETLSAELILLIGSFLSLPECVCLNLSSRRIGLVIGMEYVVQAQRLFGPQIERPRSSHKMCDVETPRHYFLRLLEKDYPESILCERCQKIHRPGHPELTRKPFGKSCSCRRDDYQTSSLYGPAFTFQKAQLAMKSHRAGLPRAASHLKRLSIMDKSSNEDLHGSLEAKIVNNRLYVKADYTRSIPIERVHHPIPFDIFLCHHMRISTVNYDNAFAVIERPITTCIVTLETPYIVQLVHQKYSCVTCPSCSTQAGLFFDENTSANQDQLTVKIWKDFGECLTPFDELWSSHCNKLSGSRKTYQRATIRSTPSNQMQEWDVKHDAMRAFEGETWRSALAHRGAVNLLSTSTTQNPPRDSQVGGGMERPNIFRELFRYMATLIRR